MSTQASSYSEKQGEYLLYIGRIYPEKGVHLAVEAALKSKKKLVIAGGVDEAQFNYFNSSIRPYVDNSNIIYVGEVDFKTKIKIFQKAMATLFPIEWDEPFGMVLLESMACGTPVIAFDRAAVREIIKNKESGFIVRNGDINEMVNAVQKISKINRKKTRKWAENNFSVSRWAEKYEKICQGLINNNE